MGFEVYRISFEGSFLHNFQNNLKFSLELLLMSPIADVIFPWLTLLMPVNEEDILNTMIYVIKTDRDLRATEVQPCTWLCLETFE